MSPGASVPWLRLWVGIALFWLAVGALTSLQQVVAASAFGGAVPSTGAVLENLLSAAAWIPFTGAVVALALRAPMGPETWRWALPLHAVAAVAVALGVNLTMALLHRLAGGVPDGGLVATAVAGAARWLHLLVLLYAVIVASTQGARHVARARRRERDLERARAELAEARLGALRGQLRPHFLFNALHTLGMLWRLGRADEGQDTLERLSALLRGVLELDGRERVTLGEELGLAEAYLAVERARFGDRLRVRVDVPEALRALAVPPLVLQPLVENAVRHAVEAGAGPVTVEVEARREGDRLVLRVRDDGPGPSASPATAGTGVGLANLRERLRHRCGPAAAVQLDAAPGGRGAVAEVGLPLPPRGGEA